MSERRSSYSEAESLADLAATEVGPRTARAMAWLFVALIVGIPLGQAAVEAGRGQAPQALALFRPLTDGSPARLLSAEHLHTFEDDLEQASLARRAVQPRLQGALSAAGGFGSDECVIGRGGWLFYRPGVDYLAGPGVLDRARLRARAKKTADPDPRPAILRLDEECRAAGVHLVLLPTPDKAALQPAQLTRRLKGAGPIPVPTNRGYDQLLAELRGRGVDVFDPAPAAVLPGEERYLVQDTHWAPAFMEDVARRVAEHVRGRVGLPPPYRAWFTLTAEKQVARAGDLVGMLRLPRGQTAFAPQAATIHPVIDAGADRLWGPDPAADVLVLGDSFTNIYSDGEGGRGLGWGQSAGFAAQLARFLERPVDVIARNGGGAAQARAELARRPDPLGGKRVLVWQFAARDLALADWPVIPLAGRGPAAPTADSERLVIEGTVVAASRTPRPFTVPYKDCLTFVKIRVERVAEGSCGHDEILAAFWGLRDNQPQPSGQHAPGERLRLTLVPLAKAAAKLDSVRYADDLHDFVHPTFFVEAEERR